MVPYFASYLCAGKLTMAVYTYITLSLTRSTPIQSGARHLSFYSLLHPNGGVYCQLFITVLSIIIVTDDFTFYHICMSLIIKF